MILRKDYVQQIQNGLAQVEVEKTEEHNDMLTLLFAERCKLKVTIHLMDTYYKFDNTAYNYSSSIVHPFENLPIIHASDIILDNTVIRVESKEHGKRVIEWWKEQGLNLDGVEGSAVGSCYGIYNGSFNFFNHDIAIRKGEKIITLPETFPSKWYMICDEENQDMGNEWLKANGSSYYKNIIGNAFCSKNNSGDRWFGYGGRASEYMDKDHPEYEKISTEQFLEHVYKPFKAKQKVAKIVSEVVKGKIKQENKMEKIIKWTEAQELIDMVSNSCEWKGKLLDLWAVKIVLKEQIKVSEELLQQGRKEASQSQKEVIDRIFGKEKEEIDLYSETGIDGAELFIKNGGGKDSLLAVRSYGEYKSVSFYLNSYFNWEIKKDNQGDLCLIPTHKE